MNTKNRVYQFKISLREISPVVWRRIQVPSNYSFWDFHVAIQDSMGWLDYHLHQISIKRPHAHKITEIGIPDDEGFTELLFVEAYSELYAKDDKP
jgi:prepilin-type processing-associated H-X9-DG protein